MKYSYLILLLGVALPVQMIAQGSALDLNLLGQRQAAMANASTALPMDGAASWNNPAGMAFMERQLYLQLGGDISRPFTSFLESPPFLDFESMDTITLSPFYAYAILRPRAYPKIALGFSINSPYGATSLWPEDWNGRFLSQEFRLTSLFFQPSFSYKISRKTSVGIGINYAAVSLLSRRAVDLTGPMETRSSVNFSGQGLGLGVNLSVHHIYNERISLALTARSPIQINIPNGLATFDVPSGLLASFPDQNFATELTLPFRLNVGIAYKPESRLQVAMDIRFAAWQSLDSLLFVLNEDVPGLTQFPQRAWTNVLSFHGGMEYIINERLQVRAGLAYNNSPVPDNFMFPDLPDGDRIGISLGAGVNLRRDLIVNASAGYNYSGERTNSLRTASFGGIYESIAYHFGIELQYQL
ncbi:MAG: outer membrane protein transport protein [Bacteroidia bacterium]|nr:outer membrane protein transport protein [Bacteroidia bacterium]